MNYDYDKDPIRLYIGGINDKIDREHLDDLFGKFAHCEHAWVSSKPPGFGFVHFKSDGEKAANEAVEALNGQEFMGCKLRVEISQTRVIPPVVVVDHGGNRGGRGSGFFGGRGGYRGGGEGRGYRGYNGGGYRGGGGGNDGGYRGHNNNRGGAADGHRGVAHGGYTYRGCIGGSSTYRGGGDGNQSGNFENRPVSFPTSNPTPNPVPYSGPKYGLGRGIMSPADRGDDEWSDDE